MECDLCHSIIEKDKEQVIFRLKDKDGKMQTVCESCYSKAKGLREKVEPVKEEKHLEKVSSKEDAPKVDSIKEEKPVEKPSDDWKIFE